MFAHDNGRTINGAEVCAGRHGVYFEEYSGIRACQRAVEPGFQKMAGRGGRIDGRGANLYKNYQSGAVFLSTEQKTKKEEEIVAKEKEAAELKKKYFGPEGELFKKRESLMAPIQDEIYNAVKDISDSKGYSLILDRASDTGIIFASPKIDISNEVLTKLGYSN